jgi:hypothetical protein
MIKATETWRMNQIYSHTCHLKEKVIVDLCATNIYNMLMFEVLACIQCLWIDYTGC